MIATPMRTADRMSVARRLNFVVEIGAVNWEGSKLVVSGRAEQLGLLRPSPSVSPPPVALAEIVFPELR